MGKGLKVSVVMAVSILLAVAFLSACGGSDSSSSDDSVATETSAQGNGGGAGQEGAANGSKDDGGGNSGGNEGVRPSHPADVKTPLKVSGGGSEQFREKGGDNSIQEYGEESEESELRAAAEVVHGFYIARSEEDWERACTYLAKSMVEQFEALAARSPSPTLKDKGCAPVLHALTRQGLPASVRRELTVVDAASLRREDERAFLIYFDVNRDSNAIPMKYEDGGWKVTGLVGTPVG